MIYTLGVDHYREQFPHANNDEEAVRRFQRFVRRCYEDGHVRLIAEEWCDDARSTSLSGTTYAEDIAANLRIEYLACDPDQAERDRLRMKRREQLAQELGISWPVQEHSREEEKINEAADEIDKRREQYWLEQLIHHGFLAKDMLFICGYGHADRFVKLLKGNRHNAVKTMIS